MSWPNAAVAFLGKCSVHDLLVLAERLALVSAAPADFIEHNGVSLCRPPAPLEDMMGASRLHFSVEGCANIDLIRWAQCRIELLKHASEDRIERESKDNVLESTPFAAAAAGQRDISVSDEVPEDWEEDLSDFDYDEVTRAWSEQVRLKQTE